MENYGLQLDQILMAGSHVRVVAWAELLKYAVFVGLALFLTPPYGACGTAAAIAATMLVAALVKSAVVKWDHAKIGGRPFLAALALFALMTLTLRLPYADYLVLPVWFAAAWALGLLRPAEIGRWLGVLRGMRLPR